MTATAHDTAVHHSLTGPDGSASANPNYYPGGAGRWISATPRPGSVLLRPTPRWQDEIRGEISHYAFPPREPVDPYVLGQLPRPVQDLAELAELTQTRDRQQAMEDAEPVHDRLDKAGVDISGLVLSIPETEALIAELVEALREARGDMPLAARIGGESA